MRRSERKSSAPKPYEALVSPSYKRQKRSSAYNDDVQHLLHSSKSSIVRVDLRQVINAACWELLSCEEQARCLALLPEQDKEVNQGQETIKPSFFEHNVVLQDALRAFQDSLSEGKRMPGYIKRTQAASRDRVAGKADEFKDQEYEEHWGDLK